MKKFLLSMVLVCFALSHLAAQESTFGKGTKVLNVGIGFGSTWYSGTYYHAQIPPISASLEFGVVDNVLEKGSIGVGPYVGFSSYKWEYSDWGYKYTNIVIGARGNFHYPLANKLDTYVGILLGYNIVSANEFGTPLGYDYSATSSGIRLAGYIGARYYFKEKFGVMAELGYGITYFNIGIALKL
ncbi:MAG: hypothetical protein Q8868_03650 [Bacteroidota bacterium]|nr:hypothetical protein [Bacteroidota bacterium]